MTAIRHLDKPGEYGPKQQICPTHRWRGQESCLLSLQGTRFRIVTALFTAKYLAAINGHMMWSEKNTVFRSEPIELKTRDGRVMALRITMAVLERLRSGKSGNCLVEKLYQHFRE